MIFYTLSDGLCMGQKQNGGGVIDTHYGVMLRFEFSRILHTAKNNLIDQHSSTLLSKYHKLLQKVHKVRYVYQLLEMNIY